SSGQDYSTLTGTVTFAAGSSTATVNVSPLDDPNVESTETVIVTLSSNAAYNIDAAKTSATVNISDNDAPAGNQTPFGGVAAAIPGKIEAENFDDGGEGVAYHDTDATQFGGAYRTNVGVDIETTTDTGGGFAIGRIRAGEWVEYTVNVANTT